MTPAEWIFALSNLGVAGAYLLIGAQVAPRLRIATPGLKRRLVQVGAVAFFALCSWTHADLAFHTFAGDAPFWFLDWHMLFQHPVQAAAGYLFWATTRTSRVSITEQEYPSPEPNGKKAHQALRELHQIEAEMLRELRGRR